MNLPISVTQNDLLEILINTAPVRPVFIWGAPGIGKSALVEQFAREVEMPCVSLLGSQLAPEDIIGIPQIRGETSEFLPPKMIARKEPYVLFLDELNACTQEVQKAFYSLIHERRIGEYHLPEGSIVVGAGNRAQDCNCKNNVISIDQPYVSCSDESRCQTVDQMGTVRRTSSMGDRLYYSKTGSSVLRTAKDRRTILYTALLAYAQ